MTSSPGELVRLEVQDGIGTIRIDRPPMNALDVQVQEEIRAAAAAASADREVHAVVLYGGEKVFAAGADVKEMTTMSYADMVERSGALQSSFTAVAGQGHHLLGAVRGGGRGAADRAGRPGGARRRGLRRRPGDGGALRRGTGTGAARGEGGGRPRPGVRPGHRPRGGAPAVRRALRDRGPAHRDGVVRGRRSGQGRLPGSLTCPCRPTSRPTGRPAGRPLLTSSAGRPLLT